MRLEKKEEERRKRLSKRKRKTWTVGKLFCFFSSSPSLSLGDWMAQWKWKMAQRKWKSRKTVKVKG